MPAPTNERQALERADLPRQLVAYQAELDATAPGHEARRERLAWQITAGSEAAGGLKRG